MRFLKLGNLINILVFKIFLDFIVGEIINVPRSKSQIKKSNPFPRSRLPDDSPILKDVYASWAINSFRDGYFALAAKCWIAAG